MQVLFLTFDKMIIFHKKTLRKYVKWHIEIRGLLVLRYKKESMAFLAEFRKES